MLTDLQAWLDPYLSVFGSNAWMQAALALIGSLVLAWVFDRLFSANIRKLTTRAGFKFGDFLIEHLHKPIYQTLILIGLALAINLLELELGEKIEDVVFSLLLTLGYLAWTIFLIRATRAVLLAIAISDRRITAINPQSVPLFQNLAMITIMVFSVYIIFTAWHVDMTAWLASAGVIGIVVGFAAKDTLANLFSGVFIMADAPYKIGDFVVLDTGERGEITHIGIRSTRLKTRDDIEVTVPNSVMGNTKIINESGGPHEKSRIRVVIGVAYGSDIDQVRQVLMDIALNDEDVCADPEARVRFRKFGGSSLDFELLCWIRQPVLRGRVIDKLNCKIYKRFIEEKIEIPYSKHDLYIKQMPD